MPNCTTLHCPNPAEDEYHFYEYVPAIGDEVEVVWELCEECCAFAVEVVEDISNLDVAQQGGEFELG